jgi:pimeloyl-ACP methyl ester carboxylesterase
LDAQDVAFDVEPGLTLRGWYVPPRNGAALVLVHGYAGNRQDLASEALGLAHAGFGLLLFDLRAHGESGGQITTGGDVEREDVLSAVRFLRERAQLPAERIGLFAFSMGANAAVRAAVKDKRLRALVLAAVTSSATDFCRDSYPRLSWLKVPICVEVMRRGGIDVHGLSPVTLVKQLEKQALLVVHGTQDPIVPVARARSVYQAAHDPKELLLVQGAGHGKYSQAGGPGYLGRLVSFFSRYLLQVPSDGVTQSASLPRP